MGAIASTFMRSFALLSLAALLASCRKPKPSTVRPAPAATPTPVPAATAVTVVAPLRWLGSASNGATKRVNTPLAVGGAEVSSAGVANCAAWGTGGVTWTALDRFGQFAGTGRVAKGEYYAVTKCVELELELLSGTRGVDLWVAGSMDFHAAPSAEWRPTPAERAGLTALVKTLEGAMLPGPAWQGCDTKVAELSESDERVHERAVVGGPLLVIAERDPQRGGAWIASFVDTTDANACLPAQFTPKAVVDLNQDGVPEVVVHTDDGPVFGDIAYGFQPLGGWHVVARGVPGSTA
jgi:hypothetical protein